MFERWIQNNMEVTAHKKISFSVFLFFFTFASGEEIDFTTPDRQSYTVVSNSGISVDDRLITFKVKVCAQAYVGLMSGPTDKDPLYVIVLGGDTNSASFLREGKSYLLPDLDRKEGPILDCNQYVEFWITWNDYTITVGLGLGLQVTGSAYLTWRSPNPLRAINNIGIATYYGNIGEWIFYIEDETSTTEGITTDGTTTKVTTTAVQTTEGTTTEDKTTEGQTTAGQTNKVTTTEDQTTLAQTPEGLTIESTTTDVTISVGTTTEGTTTESRTTISTTTEGQTNDGTATEDTPAEGTTSDRTNTYGQSTEGTRTEGTRTEVSITEGTTPDSSTTDFQTTKPSDHISPPTSSAKSLAEAILCTEDCTISYTCKCEETLGTTTSSTPVTQYKVDKKTLSSYKRRYQSASDPRKSSFYIGCVGITVLVVSCAFVVILDFVPRA